MSVDLITQKYARLKIEDLPPIPIGSEMESALLWQVFAVSLAVAHNSKPQSAH